MHDKERLQKLKEEMEWYRERLSPEKLETARKKPRIEKGAWVHPFSLTESHTSAILFRNSERRTH